MNPIGEVQKQKDNQIGINQELAIFGGLDQPDIQAKSKSSRAFGLTLAAVFGFTGLATIVVAFPFIKPGFRKICLPYVPASDVQVSNVLQALKSCRGNVVDLGSGDGRLVRT